MSTCAYFSLQEDPLAPCATSYGYAPNGNLTFKSDIGALTYDDPKHPHVVTYNKVESPGNGYSRRPRMDFSNDVDGDALRKIAERSDMTKPMEIDFAVDVPSDVSGNEAARLAAHCAERRAPPGVGIPISLAGVAGNKVTICSAAAQK